MNIEEFQNEFRNELVHETLKRFIESGKHEQLLDVFNREEAEEIIILTIYDEIQKTLNYHTLLKVLDTHGYFGTTNQFARGQKPFITEYKTICHG